MLAKCPACGDIFSRDKFAICPKCWEKETQVLENLKHLSQDMPNATIDDLATISGIGRETIVNYVRSGRLFLDTPAAKLRCEECGADIEGGRFCKKCRDKLASRFSSVSDTLKTRKKE
ncbi:MAG: hypothetical protein AAB229_03005 [Candidatus Hydrogenedentota bacterium]